MTRVTRWCDYKAVSVCETNECVRLGGCEHYELYISAVDYDADSDVKTYYYPEIPDNRHVRKLGDFATFEDAKESFYRSMKDLAEELECSYEII